MQTTDENLVQVSTLLQAISRGDLTVRMQAQADRWPHPGQRIQHQPGRRRDCFGQHRPVAAHRAAGRESGGNGRVDGGADLHREAERGQRTSGEPIGGQRV
ncbi:hypothetical protein G6F64_014878 [Rhizopus arrhizus]|uniref:Uncharacterized protein n=1 Tax=Rhizopus oryzae TaxID=64495 RepID=A0A9P6WTD0_RHIOR|nr:hypothetical protein G6F64_014878 [Rhizopus arrhizus]